MDELARAEFLEFTAGRVPALLRFAFALTGNRHEAEDLVQGALEKLVRKWGKLDNPERYVRRIIHNDFISSWRKRWRYQEELQAVLPDLVASRDAMSEVDLRELLIAALMRLAPRQRAIVVMRYLEDRSEIEVAQILECSVSTVSSQLSRALARLREICPPLEEFATSEVSHAST